MSSELLEDLPAGVYELALDGTVQRASARMASLLGMAGELTGRASAEAFVVDGDRARWRELLQTAGGTLEARSPEGEGAGRVLRHVLARRGDRFVGLAVDITDEERASDSLRNQEERMRQIAESVGAVFWMTDLSKGDMVYISPGYERIWGRTCESLYRSPISWIDAIHEGDRARVLDAAMKRQATGDYDETYRIVRLDDARIRWIRDRAFPVRDDSGRVVRIAGVAEDVTERVRTEEALRASVERFEELVNSLGGVVWEADPSTLDFTFVSQQAERYLGYHRRSG